jgi:hypothetical protein
MRQHWQLGREQMTGNDLIVVAPWIIFGGGLSVVWIRLLQSRHASRHQAERSPPPVPDPAGSGGAEPGRCGRGYVPAAPWRASAGQETISRPYTQEAQCSEKNTAARQK